MIVDELFIIYTGRYLCALSSREFNICFLLSLFYLFFFCLLFVSEAGTLTKFAVKQTVKKAKEKRKKRRETN